MTTEFHDQTAPKSPAAFHARQLRLMMADWIDPFEALKIVTSNDKDAAIALLNSAYEMVSDETNAAQLAAAHSYINDVMSGNAPAAQGKTRADPIRVICDNSEEGIELQYEWLSWRYGERDVEWKVETRGHDRVQEIVFDWFRVQKKGGPVERVEFDITAFYGRW